MCYSFEAINMYKQEEKIDNRLLVMNGKVQQEPQYGVKFQKLREENKRRFEASLNRVGRVG
jgi:hypothetical protein